MSFASPEKTNKILNGITFLNERQIKIVEMLLEDETFFIQEYISSEDRGKLAFHLQVVLCVSLAKALKITDNIFSYFDIERPNIYMSLPTATPRPPSSISLTSDLHDESFPSSSRSAFSERIGSAMPFDSMPQSSSFSVPLEKMNSDVDADLSSFPRKPVAVKQPSDTMSISTNITDSQSIRPRSEVQNGKNVAYPQEVAFIPDPNCMEYKLSNKTLTWVLPPMRTVALDKIITGGIYVAEFSFHFTSETCSKLCICVVKSPCEITPLSVGGSDIDGVRYQQNGAVVCNNQNYRANEPFESGDTVAVEINTIRKEIRFFKNGKAMLTGFNEIPPELQLAVRGGNKGTSITLNLFVMIQEPLEAPNGDKVSFFKWRTFV